MEPIKQVRAIICTGWEPHYDTPDRLKVACSICATPLVMQATNLPRVVAEECLMLCMACGGELIAHAKKAICQGVLEEGRRKEIDPRIDAFGQKLMADAYAKRNGGGDDQQGN